MDHKQAGSGILEINMDDGDNAMKRRNNIQLLAIRRMVWVELTILFSLAFVVPRGVFAIGADLTASAEATRLLVTLVRSPTIQKELKLDARQAAAVDAAVAEIDEPLWRLRNAPAQRSAVDVARCGISSRRSFVRHCDPSSSSVWNSCSGGRKAYGP